MESWNIPWNIGKRGVEQNVPRTFVEQSESANALLYIVERPWNIRGTLLNEMIAHSVEHFAWNTGF